MELSAMSFVIWYLLSWVSFLLFLLVYKSKITQGNVSEVGAKINSLPDTVT